MIRFYVPLICLCLSVVGCFSVKQDAPEQRFYSIETVRTGAPVVQRFAGGLTIMPMRISPLNSGRELIYLRKDRFRETDYSHQFIDNPEKLVREELRKWISTSGLFDNVETDTALRRGKYYVQSSINYFESDFRDQEHPAAYVEIEFWLLEYPSAKEIRRHLHKVYRASVLIKKDNNDQRLRCVDALSKAVGIVFGKFEKSLIALEINKR